MGLDSVELLVEVENAFGIEISNPEAEKIITVGQFHDSVWEKIKDRETLSCKSAILFYRLRKFFYLEFGILSKNFKTDTKLETLIPKEERLTKWNNIQKELDLKLPNLILPKNIKILIQYFGWVSILGGFAFSLIAENMEGLSKAFWGIPVLGIIMTITLNRVFKPLRIEFEQKTIRDLVNQMLTLNNKKLNSLYGSNRIEMEKVIDMIINEKTGVPFEEIKKNAEIVNDLRID